MKPRQQYYKINAEKIIKKFKQRGIEGYYYYTSEEAVNAVIDVLPENATVAWGGSMTLEETGLKEALRNGPFTCYDRDKASGPDEQRKIFLQSFSANYYFMSSNAITMDGKLVNIDGRGSRLAPFIYGPDYVIVLSGMNKVVRDEESAVERVKHLASPINCIRLDRETPCTKTGECSDCLSPDCICTHTVITRRSHVEGRLKVFLIGEELGY